MILYNILILLYYLYYFIIYLSFDIISFEKKNKFTIFNYDTYKINIKNKLISKL